MKYKTWEVMKMLEENPKRKFESHYAGEKQTIELNENGYFYFKIFKGNGEMQPSNMPAGGFNGNVSIGYEWEEVRQPVHFIEAVKAYADGKTITCEVGKNKYIYKDGFNGSPMRDQKDYGVCPNEILNGTWFVAETEEE